MSDTAIDLSSQNVFDIMHTTRAMRRLKPDPVADELIVKILNAGLRAANGGNTQTWHFLVVKDQAIKKAVQVWYKKAFEEIVGPRYASSAPPPGSSSDKYHRQHGAVEYLTEHYHEAPVWIVACTNNGDTSPGREPGRMAGASIYPAVQNMLLAARALGLGSTLTTRHMLFAEEADKALELPPGMLSYAILPIGYPMGKFGPVGRGKLSEFVSFDRVGQPWDAVD
jgi:nitroreductase